MSTTIEKLPDDKDALFDEQWAHVIGGLDRFVTRWAAEAAANVTSPRQLTVLNKLKAGVTVVNVNVQSVQAPEQVQAAFDDAFKAGADRERLKNEGQAYANDVIPKAQGTAARLREEAAGYAARVVAQAEGDAERFKSVLAEYKKAPGVTRDRLYTDTMAQVYSNVTKVMVDSRQGSNLLYLPLDKIMQMSGANGAAPAPAAAASEPVVAPNPAAASTDARSRDGLRSRDREVR